MLQFLKRLFLRENNSKADRPASKPLSARLQPPATSIIKPPATDPLNPLADPFSAMPSVETASLSLAAIIARLPDDLKGLVVNPPSNAVMVALPLKTILKQLPSGSVKMSWASVVRQAPQGTFSVTKVEDKRLVEVPLVEIFKRVNPALLKRRDDQKMTELADEGFDIFGDETNPHAIAPQVGDRAPLDPQAKAPPAPKPDSAALRKPAEPQPAPAARPASQPVPQPAAPVVQPVAKTAAAAPAAPAIGGNLTFKISDLLTGWPEPFKSEAEAMGDATVELPAAEVGPGLAKGRVAFKWGVIRGSSTPPPAVPSQGDEGTELILPLKAVAPVFMKHSKGGGAGPVPRKAMTLDSSIPDLFTGGRGPAAPPTVPTPVPEAPAPKESAPPPEQPAAESAAPTGLKLAANLPIGTRVADLPAATPEPAKPAEKPLPKTVGEIFGQPDKTDWSPKEIITQITTLPDIAGAVMALQEGFAVAANLPEPFKAEVMAAFLPQAFGKMSQYATEMGFGDVADMELGAKDSRYHLFRHGQVYFAVLGKAGASLPTHELRLIAAELAKQS